MIRLSGLTLRDELRPDGDIAIEVTGLRPGEKLYEELLIGDDARGTEHPRIMVAQECWLLGQGCVPCWPRWMKPVTTLINRKYATF